MSDFAIFVESVMQAATAGLLVGCIYGLMCLGLSLIFGVMRVINFAQGEFLMLGMYFAFYMVTSLGLVGSLGPLVTIAFGWLGLGESLGAWQLVGAGLVLAGVMLVSLRK